MATTVSAPRPPNASPPPNAGGGVEEETPSSSPSPPPPPPKQEEEAIPPPPLPSSSVDSPSPVGIVIPPEVVAEAEAFKAQGSEAFAIGHYLESLKLYSKAIRRILVCANEAERNLVAASGKKGEEGDLVEGGVEQKERKQDPLSITNSITTTTAAAASNDGSIIGGDSVATAIGNSEDSKALLLACAKLDLHKYYTNRSFCNIKLENYGSAIADAEEALRIKPDFAKANYRRANAYFFLGKFKLALKDYQIVQRLSAEPDVYVKLKACERQVKQGKFASAISTDKSVPTSQSVDLDSMEVSVSYTGPTYVPVAAMAQQDERQRFMANVFEYLKESTENLISKKFAYMMVLDMIKQLKALPNLVDIEVPEGEQFTVCGDIHGQFYDLLNIFELNDPPSSSNPYLFNGDFIDRGSFSVECILALFAAKLAYPAFVHLARGNHETQNMNRLYGFKGEVVAKYDEKLYDLFSECFCYLPLAHRIEKKILVVHGGIFGDDNATLEDLQSIDRNREPADGGIMTELLWSDPQEAAGRAPSKRGVACQFGPDVTKRFLATNKLEMIIRSHEVKDNGYETEHDGMLVTVFSAPNYCDQMGNIGAFVKLKGGSNITDLEFVSFDAVDHPPCRPLQYASPLFGMV
eukprot:GHVS01032833.1.p1 GENE.GHVS01032833.1~~GHVS01032833.1.p1  ORF type:complete len:636 (+),score=140.93 GHVS01032833.1:118-2025(+)